MNRSLKSSALLHLLLLLLQILLLLPLSPSPHSLTWTGLTGFHLWGGTQVRHRWQLVTDCSGHSSNERLRLAAAQRSRWLAGGAAGCVMRQRHDSLPQWHDVNLENFSELTFPEKKKSEWATSHSLCDRFTWLQWDGHFSWFLHQQRWRMPPPHILRLQLLQGQRDGAAAAVRFSLAAFPWPLELRKT